MEITPPISPTREVENSSISLLSGRGNVGFYCLGEASRRAPFDSRGFLRSGEGDLTGLALCDKSFKHCFVKVFDQIYDLDNTCKEDLERLFRVTRNRMCLLDTAEKSTTGTYGLLTGVNSPESIANSNQIRQDLREFFFMLRILLNMQSNKEDCSWALEQLLPTILRGLYLTRAQLGWLTDLPTYVLSHAHAKSSSQCTAQAAFHLFHCHLELRWLHISILWTLTTCMNTSSRFEASQISEMVQTYKSDPNAHNLSMSAIELCMSDLVEMAVLKFNRLNPEEIVQTSLFNCMCVKELWLLLRFASENSFNQSTQSFWKIITNLLDVLVKDDNVTNSTKQAWRPLQTPRHITCSDPGLFSLWLLRSLGELYTYERNGERCSAVAHEIESSQHIIRRVLNDVASSSDINEPQRRVLVSLVSGLMTYPWKPKPEPIMMLWEGFCRKLDSAFQLPGAPATCYTVASETVPDIVNSVSYDGLSTNKRSMTSFDLFLSMMGKYLNLDPSMWKLKMRGRFYSKLSEKKVDGLSELGLYHFTQLIITIAVQTDLEDLALQFQKWVRFNEKDEKRNTMVMKAQLCFVFLCAQKGKSISSLVIPLIEKLDLLTVRSHSLAVQAFVDNLHIIVNSNESLPTDLHLICGEWILNFLRQNQQDSVRSLLNVMVSIMEKVQTHLDSNNTVGGGVQKLVHALQEFLLPFVMDYKRTSLEQIADLAVHFTLIGLEFTNAGKDSFQSLLLHFMTKESSHIKFVRRYLYQILSKIKIRDLLKSNNDQQILVVQAWIRCCTLNMSVDVDQEKCIAKQIFQMPLLKHMIKTSNHLDELNHFSDPLFYLLESIGNNSSASRKEFLILIEPLKLLMPAIKASLFPSKSKDRGWNSEKLVLPKDVIIRAFHVFGTLTSDCSYLIYEKNTSKSFLIVLLGTLILPAQVLDMDVRLPLAMDEGLRKSLLLYLRGLHKLDPSKEKCLLRFFSDIIQVYVPRFGVTPHNDPFTKIWDEPEHMPTGIFIIQMVCSTLFNWDVKTNSAHKYYIQGLHLINELVKRNDCDDMLLGVLIDNVFPSCLQIVGRVTDLSGAGKRHETEKTFKYMFESEAYLTHSNLWDQTTRILTDLSKKYLSFSGELFMRMLFFLLKDELRAILKRFLPTLKCNVREVIAKRGSGNDKKLEDHMARLEAGLSS